MTITDRYLKDPAAFPSPGDGEPWGNEELWIDFVGGPYRVTGLNEMQRRRLAENFAEVCIEAPAAKAERVRISVCRMSPGHFQPPPPTPFLMSFDLDARPDHVKVAGGSMCGRIECRDSTAGLLWTATDREGFTRNIFENFFRMVVTYRLLDRGGLLLHSAGIVNRGRAYLFPGRSGDGKSTLSRLSLQEGRTVLSDDMNAITWHEDKPRVEKVPFAGDLGRSWSRSASYPLHAIIALRQSDRIAVQKLPPTRAMALMAACTPYLNADSIRSPMLLENLRKLTEAVPTHILDFSLKKGVWSVIEEAVKP